VFADEGLENGEDLFLLTSRQLGGGFKQPAHLAARTAALRLDRLAQQFVQDIKGS
jgi:hypothetical protein